MSGGTSLSSSIESNALPSEGAEWSRTLVSYEVTKRILDVVFASMAIALLTPVFLLVAVVVKSTSSGPIVFRQRRLGRGGREFWCYKFRTMVNNAEQLLQTSEELLARFGDNYKIKNDPRMTRPGSLLRKSSLDELPQLFNVLAGTMSLIGPRPIVPSERSKYREHGDKLLSVKPGLGGYWQVYGRSDTTYSQRIEMDMYYIENRSVRLDLKLMALTACAVIRRQGAY